MDVPDDRQVEALLLAQAKLMKTRMRQGLTPMSRRKLAAIREEVGDLFAIEDPLIWLQPGREKDCSQLRNERLKGMLKGVRLGLWALCANSLNHLEREIIERRPSCILEMGSGVSTLALQAFCAPLREAGHDVRIISVEQEERFAIETRDRLKKHGLAHGVDVVVCPHHDRLGVFGRDIVGYDFAMLPDRLAGDMADFVVIDGPFGPPGSRVAVLPDLLGFGLLAPNAYFLMDDALRDGELWVYDIWTDYEGIRPDGVVWVGKGFLVGSVTG